MSMTTSYPSLHTHAPDHDTCPALWDALRDVEDPEMPLNVVDMGLIVAITRAQPTVVELKLTFTALGCPAMDFIMDDIRERLLREPDVQEVTIEVVWSPAWSSARLSAEGIETLRCWGISA